MTYIEGSIRDKFAEKQSMSRRMKMIFPWPDEGHPKFDRTGRMSPDRQADFSEFRWDRSTSESIMAKVEKGKAKE
ncbi:MAG: hypothetical protein ABL999_14320 [Pyrinomonadaceae bacterium]